MKALLLVAHGSRRTQSNDEIEALAASLREQSAEFDLIDHAFLELVEPSIEQGFQKLVDLGAQHITVMPYFLSAGNHVIKDVPKIVKAFAQQHPKLTIAVAPHFGSAPGVAELMLSLANNAKTP
ncbi:MAG: sirohydrochlorin ferrochelatase [Saprospiraceae bacterium]|jgi:sirohydrochlorin ferrochelatase